VGGGPGATSGVVEVGGGAVSAASVEADWAAWAELAVSDEGVCCLISPPQPIRAPNAVTATSVRRAVSGTFFSSKRGLFKSKQALSGKQDSTGKPEGRETRVSR
jgi:hypothetical protein